MSLIQGANELSRLYFQNNAGMMDKAREENEERLAMDILSLAVRRNNHLKGGMVEMITVNQRIFRVVFCQS